MKKSILSLLIVVLVVFGLSHWYSSTKKIELKYTEFTASIVPMKPDSKGETGDQERENALKRVRHEALQLMDPNTGRIPEFIKQRELVYAKNVLSLNANPTAFSAAQANGSAGVNTNAEPTRDFENAGPYNVGGRTRGLGLDVTDENMILLGSVSGGVWRSTDQGLNWTRTTAPEQHPAVTSIIQDVRSGKTDIWYYGTGERFFSSASESGAFYLGNGIYKSTDRGASWDLISATAAAGTSGTDVLITQETFSFIDELAIDATNPSGTEIYAAGTSKIIRSEDGFETYSIVLGEDNIADNYTDVAMTSTGKVFATIGSTNFNGENGEDGVFMSDDGLTWTNINPQGFPTNTPRIEIGIDPSNENIVYFITVDGLFKFDDSDDSWVNLSANLPRGDDFGAGHHGQFGFDLYISVHPDDSDVLYAGGINLLRSTDGFTSPNNIEQIGGYRPDDNPNDFRLYPSHHPDLHEQVFFPSDPNKMLTASDGGIHVTFDNQEDAAGDFKVEWDSLNLGYVTTQFFHGDIHGYDIANQFLLGGAQDNGSWVKVGTAVNDPWVEAAPGDGTYAAMNYNSLFFSAQNGAMVKYVLNPNNNTYEFVENVLSPSLDDDDFLFVNPYIYNPVDQDQLFVAALGGIFVTNDIRENPEAGDWVRPVVPASLSGIHVSALASSTQPEGVLYFGDARGGVYRIDDVRGLSSTTQARELSRNGLPNGYIIDMAVDPENADRVIIVFSNYGIVSAWISENGGSSWSSISGNLEENANGTGAGPSLRTVDIMPDGSGGAYYFIGTSVGLFMATALDGDNTNWVQQGASEIGNIVIAEVATRPIEGLVVAYTHGNGVFTASYEVDMIANINYSIVSENRVVLRANESNDADRPLGYQWLLDGEVIVGANAASFEARLPGIYQVRLFFSLTESVLSNEVDLSIALITSIDDRLLTEVEDIIVDANPSDGIFNLAFPKEFIGDFKLEVIDANGSRIVSKRVEGYVNGEQITVDLTNAPDGLYILRAANGNIGATTKLLKKVR